MTTGRGIQDCGARSHDTVSGETLTRVSYLQLYISGVPGRKLSLAPRPQDTVWAEIFYVDQLADPPLKYRLRFKKTPSKQPFDWIF